ncbi:MAG: undecaprenyldiphospho-muramoylpentapeptide beta-N-acetylglucosaminyltransferase [Clostridiales Family XIII bacterium]|jgi:UDP-N-acetylglucosamine--N-acetylmuramyl-(pentapeptide) pyrophosphoryl-undecaprenol N-acetylglucosamine transferase|nr:undecaprenyldiphospho-muramoylpentapeptide beta-N-acetylglucosaminyltransferase [Clostridiales Family XIII bacterium]
MKDAKGALRVVMAGGASGGHLYPALSVAEKIRRKDPGAEILFIGAKKEMGAGIVERNGYEIRYIDVRGFDRRNLFRNVAALKDLAASGRQIRRIFADFEPTIAVGTGGYVCGPVIREARRAGLGTFIHEQNVIPGMANRLAEKYADTVFVAFGECAKHFRDPRKIVVTGNPVRRAFLTAGAMRYREKIGIAPGDLALLVFGGSNGADRINEVVSDMLIDMKDENGIEVFFITGAKMHKDVVRKLSDAGVTRNRKIHVIEYSESIHEYFAASDLIIARSGAMTVSEIAVTGRASILIPSPNVTGNHQYFNARTLGDRGAAILMDEGKLTPKTLRDEVLRLKANKAVLNRMSDAAKALGRPDATDIIHDHILESVERRR